jgi:transcription elongation factor GreA
MVDRDREVLLTAEGLKKLEDELEHLKTVRRREVAERIKVARDFGDLSENSEYEEAKNEQAFVEGRIATLEKLLRNARVVDESDSDPRRVGIGSTVALRDLSSGEVFEYTIVGSTEADPSQARISYQSPVGQAVLDQLQGSQVEVRLPGGVARYEIVAVTR